MVPLRSKTDILKQWLRKHKKPLLIGLAVFIAVSSAWTLTHSDFSGTQRVSRHTTSQEEVPLTLPAQLTGREVDPQIAQRHITGVIIENSPDARPQTGLDAAGIVFEAVTEGGITRFLALYQDTDPGVIGPVRSLRPPFVDWFMGFDTSIAHVGGSAQALDLVRNRNAKDMDQFRYSEPYYRDNSRFAPHNMYTTIKSLRDLEKRLGYTRSRFKEIPRSDDALAENPSATVITVDYSSSLYQAQFRYQASNNTYTRRLAGSPHTDAATGNTITVNNVVVIKMPTRQSGQYAVMDTIGSGEALVFKNGNIEKARWRQRRHDERIELLNGEGKEVPLNRGDTWFAVLPAGRSVTY